MKTVYKVVWSDMGSITGETRIRVNYTIGKEIFPKVGKLFALRTLEAARALVGISSCKILECRTSKISRLRWRLPNFCFAETIIKFWENPQKSKFRKKLEKEYILVDSVIPVKIVE